MVCDDLLLVVVGVSDSCGDLWVLGFARFGLVFGFWVWCAIGFLLWGWFALGWFKFCFCARFDGFCGRLLL